MQFAVDADGSPVLQNDVLAQRQAQPAAGKAGDTVRHIGLEHVGQHLLPDAGTPVAEQHLRVRAGFIQPDGDVVAVAGVQDAVQQQVKKHRFNPFGVETGETAAFFTFKGQADSGIPDEVPAVCGKFLQECEQVAVAQAEPGGTILKLGELRQLAGGAQHHHAAFADEGQLLHGGLVPVHPDGQRGQQGENGADGHAVQAGKADGGKVAAVEVVKRAVLRTLGEADDTELKRPLFHHGDKAEDQRAGDGAGRGHLQAFPQRQRPNGGSAGLFIQQQGKGVLQPQAGQRLLRGGIGPKHVQAAVGHGSGKRTVFKK